MTQKEYDNLEIGNLVIAKGGSDEAMVQLKLSNDACELFYEVMYEDGKEATLNNKDLWEVIL